MNPSRRLMIVGDNCSFLANLEFFLRKIGYEVFAPRTAAQALDLVPSTLPKVILVGEIHGEVDGVEFCERAKATPGGQGAWVVLITNDGTMEFHERAAEAGVDFLMRDPVDPSDVGVDLYTLLSGDIREAKEVPPGMRVFRRIPKRPHSAVSSHHTWHTLEQGHSHDPIVIHKSENHLPSASATSLMIKEPKPSEGHEGNEAPADLGDVHDLLVALAGSFQDTNKRLEAVLAYIELISSETSRPKWA